MSTAAVDTTTTTNNNMDRNNSVAHDQQQQQQQRVVQVVIEEDSRECPSQQVGEVCRDDWSRAGANERRGSGLLQTQHMVHYKPLFNRVAGLRSRHTHNKAFRERRDCNSFDSHDSDDDESVVLRDPMAVCKQHHNSSKPYISPAKVDAAVVVEAGDSGKGMPGNNNSTSMLTKRKTPSPAMGVEPAPVSVVPLGGESEMMDVDEEHKQKAETNTEEEEESYDSDNSLPSYSRRLSLSPVSRRLSFQFDSISIMASKPSRSKRRKTCDTSLQS